MKMHPKEEALCFDKDPCWSAQHGRGHLPRVSKSLPTTAWELGRLLTVQGTKKPQRQAMNGD